MISSMLTCNDFAFVTGVALGLAFEGWAFEALSVTEFAATAGTMTGPRVSLTCGISANFFVTPLFAATLRGFLPCGISCDIRGTSCVYRIGMAPRPPSGYVLEGSGEMLQL